MDPAGTQGILVGGMGQSQPTVAAGVLLHDRWPPHGYTNFVPESAGIDQNTFKALMEANNIPVEQADKCYSLVQEVISRTRSAPYDTASAPAASQTTVVIDSSPATPKPMDISAPMPPASWPDGAAIPAEIVAKFPELADGTEG